MHECQYTFSGPFDSEEAFNNAVIDAYQSKAPKRQIKNFLSGMLCQNKHQIVFTHGDLRLQNIMANDGSVNGILDWEFSRWYPEYWEFSKALYVWKVAEWLDWLPSTDPSTLLCWICGSFILDWNLVVIFIYLRSCTLPHAPVSFPGIRIDSIVPNMTRIYGETVWGGLVDHFGHYPNLIKRWIGRFRRYIYGVHIVLW